MGSAECIAEEKIAMLPKSTPISRTKGGLIAMPFIIVNESFERVSSIGLMPNMIFYLLNGYHMDAANGSIILSLWSALSDSLSIFGAILSDSYLGRFKVIALGTFASLLGTTLLWSTSMFPWMKPPPCTTSSADCDSATPLQFLVLFSSFGLISVGACCVRPCSMAFGADQLNNEENPYNERVLDSYFNWYYVSITLSLVIAMSVIVYIQDQFGWQIGLGVPAFLMILSLVAFLLGSFLYLHVKPNNNIFITLLQVPVAAYRKRKINMPPPHKDHYFLGDCAKIAIPSDNLRCLNRACVIRDSDRELKLDGSPLKSWSLCSVDEVEIVKSIVRLVPISMTGIMIQVALSNGYTTLQAKTMDRHLTSNFEIPAGAFSIFQVVTITVWIAFYDRALVPILGNYCGMPRGLGTKVRMGLGLLLSCIAMLVGSVVEWRRRNVAMDKGLEDQPDAVVDMSALWLAPQLVLLGLGEAFNAVAQMEFFYTHLSKNMSSFAVAIFTLEVAVADLVAALLVKLVDNISSRGGNPSWLSTNLNKGHVDYYYLLISFFCLLSFLYFLICSRAEEPSKSNSHRTVCDYLEEDTDYRDLASV